MLGEETLGEETLGEESMNEGRFRRGLREDAGQGYLVALGDDSITDKP